MSAQGNGPSHRRRCRAGSGGAPGTCSHGPDSARGRGVPTTSTTSPLATPVPRHHMVPRPLTPPMFIVLRSEPRSVSRAREFVSHIMESWGWDASAVKVVLSELVSNAVIHAVGGTFSVCVARTESGVTVDVVDSRPDLVPLLPARRAPIPAADPGDHHYGLKVAATFADTLDVLLDADAGTKTLRATFAAKAPS